MSDQQSKIHNLPPVPKGPSMLSPATYRTIRDAVNQIMVNKRPGGNQLGNFGDGSLVLRLKNTTGATRPRFSPVQVGAHNAPHGTPAFDKQNKFAFYPADQNTLPEFVLGVTLESIPNLNYGRVMILGITSLTTYVNSLLDGFVKIEANGQAVTTTEPTSVRVIDPGPNAGGETIIKVMVGGGGGGGSPIVPVILSKSGGVQGTGTTAPTWTYNVELATNPGTNVMTNVDPTVSPHHWVRHLGQMSEANFGLAWSTNGTYELTWINEQTITAECLPDGSTPLPGPDGPTAPAPGG